MSGILAKANTIRRNNFLRLPGHHLDYECTHITPDGRTYSLSQIRGLHRERQPFRTSCATALINSSVTKRSTQGC